MDIVFISSGDTRVKSLAAAMKQGGLTAQVEFRHMTDWLNPIQVSSGEDVVILEVPSDHMKQLFLCSWLFNRHGQIRSPFILIYDPVSVGAELTDLIGKDKFALSYASELEELVDTIIRRSEDYRVIGECNRSSSVCRTMQQAVEIDIDDSGRVISLNSSAIIFSTWLYGDLVAPEDIWEAKLATLAERRQNRSFNFTLNDIGFHFQFDVIGTGSKVVIRNT